MSSLAVIFTVYRRPWALAKIEAALRAQTRKPDELWVMVEDEEDEAAVHSGGLEAHIFHSPVPRIDGRPTHNPLGLVVNRALDHIESDYITYLTDDSIPSPDKYRLMAGALDEHPDWGAVYCSQDFGTANSPEDWLAGGTKSGVRNADGPQHDPYCRVDHTQVMHRRANARWPLDYGERRLSDAHFFRALVAEVGPLMPVPEVLDWTRQLPDGLSKR